MSAHRARPAGSDGSPAGGARRAFVAAWRRFEEGAVAGRAVVGGLTLAFVTAALLQGSPTRADELRGTVTDSLGTPVVNADFDVFDLDGNKLAPTDNTDAAGKYRLTMPAGRYDVLVQPVIGGGFAPKMVRNVDVAGVVTLDWIVPPAFRQLGRVRDESGRAVFAARIEFDRLADGVRSPALGNVSSAFGTFAAYVEHGTFSVTATPPESTGLAPARIGPWTMPGPDTLNFTLVRASHFSGLVRDAAGAAVALARLAFDREADSVRVPSAENRTGADGTFRARVAPGRYRVLVEPPRGVRLTSRRVSGVDLRSDASLDVTLDPGWQLGGQVLDRAGRPLVGADWDVAEEATSTSVPTPGDNTDADGRYALVLPPGVYRLTLSPPRGSGLDTLVFRGVSVSRDTTFDYSYAGGGPPSAPASLRLVPLRNPTYRTATVRLALPEAAEVRVDIFDATGRRVRVLASGPFAAGTHDLAWDGRHENGASSEAGIYFVRAIAGERRGTTRFVLLPRPPSY